MGPRSMGEQRKNDKASSEKPRFYPCFSCDDMLHLLLRKAKDLGVPLQNLVHAAGIIDFCEVGKLTVEGGTCGLIDFRYLSNPNS